MDRVGTTLGHYTIVAELGKGGMGVVYAATDTRLGRTVALKVLPADVAADSERRARFEREARTVASLNHPNIVTIYSVEEEDGTNFLTMERVEGETLTARIDGRAMILGDLLDVAIPLADAVGAAHRAGVTHRDLKPDNVMLDAEGRIKVLDFGLAKLFDVGSDSEAGTHFPTASVTAEGKILGTAAYMSPEQAEGKAVTPASDVFSLGTVLYEMATGSRPFVGDTPISTISSILRDTPPSVTEINRALPRYLARIVRRCLTKDPARRYPTAVELRNELEVLREEMQSGELDAPAVAEAVASEPRRGTGIPSWLAAAAVVVVGAVVWIVAGRGGSTDGISAATGIGTVQHLTYQTGIETAPTLSPDGDYVAYAAGPVGQPWDIHLLRVGGRKPINLTEGTPEADHQPAFSPDGETIAFRSERDGGGLFVMGATGEAVRRLTDFGYNPTWSPDGTSIAFCTEPGDDPLNRETKSALWVVDVATGDASKIHDGDAVTPSWSPNGHRIAFWKVPIGGSGSGQRDLWTIRPDGTDPVAVNDDPALDWNPVWSPDGRWLYFSSDRGGAMNVWRWAIDEESGAVTGDAVAATVPSAWAGPLSFSPDGRNLAYAVLSKRTNLMKVDVDLAAGRIVGSPEAITSGARSIDSFDVSPDGRRIVFRSYGVREDLFVVNADGSDLRKLTDDPDKDRGPHWHPDGDRVAFYSTRSGRYEIWEIRADGSGLRPLTDTEGASLWQPTWAPDGSGFAAHNHTDGTWLFPASDTAITKGEAEQLPPAGDPLQRFTMYRWSRDGRRQVGTVVRPDIAAWRRFAVYSLDTGTYEMFDIRLSYPCWTPDERGVIGLVDGTLAVFDLASGTTRSIAGSPVIRDNIILGPDGRTLYYLDDSTEADIWLATLE